jgi:hypothetical protein
MITVNLFNGAFLKRALLLMLVTLSSNCYSDQTCKGAIITPSSVTEKFLLSETAGKEAVAFDTGSGLMWMRCSMGQNWDGATCNEFPANYSWEEALKVSEAHEYAGYSDWRLPNKNELLSILEVSCVKPSINLTIFPNTPISFYWSSTPFAAILNQAWAVNFNNGFISDELKTGKLHVRLVRGGL